MAVNKIQLAVNYRKNNDAKSAQYGHYYAEVDTRKTLTTDGLVEHIMGHNVAVGPEAVAAVLKVMAECIPELLAQGQPVKIDGLGTFMPSVTNVKGGATEAQMKNKQFTPSSMIKAVHIRFKPDGTEMNNLTSTSFLTNHVSLESQFVCETVKRTVDGKEKKITQFVTLEDFRNPADA